MLAYRVVSRVHNRHCANVTVCETARSVQHLDFGVSHQSPSTTMQICRDCVIGVRTLGEHCGMLRLRRLVTMHDLRAFTTLTNKLP